MTSRSGELRHEEFSHFCIHETLLDTRIFLFSSLGQLAKKTLGELCLIIFPEQSLKSVWRKKENN